MPKKQHTEEQIISALKQYEAGNKTADIFQKLGFVDSRQRRENQPAPASKPRFGT